MSTIQNGQNFIPITAVPFTGILHNGRNGRYMRKIWESRDNLVLYNDQLKYPVYEVYP